MFPHIAVRTPILPKPDLNYRSRSAGYEIDDQTLSLDDSIALTVRQPQKTNPKTWDFGRQLDVEIHFDDYSSGWLQTIVSEWPTIRPRPHLSLPTTTAIIDRNV